jgi:hypothetical protein
MSFVASLDEPLLAELYSYWQDRRRGCRAPSRADIDPIDIPHLLPHIALTEIVRSEDGDTTRIRYRLAGTEVERRVGCALTNRYLDELKTGPYLDCILGLYDRIMAEMMPLYSENSFHTDHGDTLRAKRLMLPLSDDQETVNMVLAALVYVDSDPNDRSTVLRSQQPFSTVGPDTL